MGNTCGVHFAGALAAAFLLSTPASAADINLLCRGAVAKDETVGSALDLLGGTARTERIASEDTILFTVRADSTGEARLPRPMQSAYKEPIKGRPGWFTLIEVRQDADEITGKLRIHSMNKPKFRLDRLSGVVTIQGQLADFSGQCEAYDPATVERRF